MTPAMAEDAEEKRDRTKRHAPDSPASNEEKVEEAMRETFPASDPPSFTRRTPRKEDDAADERDAPDAT
jgi:hypothetical protein